MTESTRSLLPAFSPSPGELSDWSSRSDGSREILRCFLEGRVPLACSQVSDFEETLAERGQTFLFFARGRAGEESGRSMSEVSVGSLRRGFRFPGAMSERLKGRGGGGVCKSRISACHVAKERRRTLMQRIRCKQHAGVGYFQQQCGSNATVTDLLQCNRM